MLEKGEVGAGVGTVIFGIKGGAVGKTGVEEVQGVRMLPKMTIVGGTWRMKGGIGIVLDNLMTVVEIEAIKVLLITNNVIKR